jgi:iron complex outermembrane receptor protein
MRRLSFSLLLQLLVVAALGQHQLKGVITGSGEPLAGASVVILNTHYGVSSGSDGSFEFKNLKKGEYEIRVSFMGFETKTLKTEVPVNQRLVLDLQPSTIMTDEIIISATLAGNKTPLTFTNLSKEEISARNMGQDIPYLLQLSPSFVVTSDAGAGVGYTNFRIRGTDLNRINVTINGIPMNDAESHSTLFVDQPDLASSLEKVQIQRGVGTSTNGAAAFGASINLQTSAPKKEPYAQYNTSAGSFNTFKNTVSAGTGLLNEKFTLDARLSKISSDGFVDRAFSDLKSFFISGGYYLGNTVLKANVFSGIETSYQAWNGVPSVRLNNDVEGMKRYEEHGHYTPEETQEMLSSNSRTYNLYNYKNQVDHYQQDQYQVLFSHKFSPELNLNVSGFYVRGIGHYESFKRNRKLKNYQIPPVIIDGKEIKSTDLIQRKWLDNHFYGNVFSLNWNKRKSAFTLGGGWNKYDGDHYGNVIWTEFSGNAEYNHQWYFNNGLKTDFNFFAKEHYQITEKINLFADLQYRRISYVLSGIDDDLHDVSQKHEYHFFNPKFGIYYSPSGNQNLYLSYAIANREPNRSTYIDADPQRKLPTHETLRDWELGYDFRSSSFSGSVNFYSMNYKDQLILTGEINNTGRPIMVNVDNSFRRGVEFQTALRIFRTLNWMANVSFSQNKIKNFTEYIDNWDTGAQNTIERGTTDIAFSPVSVSNSQIIYEPVKNLNFAFISSHVGRQYIDNTSDKERSLNAWFVNNLKVDYSIGSRIFEKITLHLMVNNIFNEEYESNAWVYSYILGGKRYKIDGYFPQAGRHFMAGIDFSF